MIYSDSLKTFAIFFWVFVIFLTACESKNRVPVEVLLQPEKNFVEYNGSFVMTWSAKGVDYCIAKGDWLGNVKHSGAKTLGPLTRDSEYVLECYDSGERISQSVTIKVGKPRIPDVRIAASPLNVAYDGETRVSWSTQHVTDCEARGAWSGKREMNGSISLDGLTTESQFQLVCQGAQGPVRDSVTVNVFEEGIDVPYVNLIASPAQVPFKGSTTLKWSSSGADICRAWGDWSGSKSRNGTEIIRNLNKDSRFILICTQAAGRGVEGRDAIDVRVQKAPVSAR